MEKHIFKCYKIIGFRITDSLICDNLMCDSLSLQLEDLEANVSIS